MGYWGKTFFGHISLLPILWDGVVLTRYHLILRDIFFSHLVTVAPWSSLEFARQCDELVKEKHANWQHNSEWARKIVIAELQQYHWIRNLWRFGINTSKIIWQTSRFVSCYDLMLWGRCLSINTLEVHIDGFKLIHNSWNVTPCSVHSIVQTNQKYPNTKFLWMPRNNVIT